jgi:aspartate carbamoyltransferase catalytic subunit
MSLLSIDQLSREALQGLLQQARQMEAGRFARDSLQGKILIPLFFEPSTRTRLSFETAMLRLGGQVLSVPETGGLALAKGESLPDTIRVVSSFGDLLVMRHSTEAAVALADQYAAVPVINGGNGCDEHPTQALLDLYTITKEQGTIDGLNVGLVGDLKHARTMHSLAKGLTYYHVKLFLVSPEELRLPAACQQVVRGRRIPYIETPNLNEVIPELDVIYTVMLQHHRIADPQVVERLRRTYYCLTPELLARAKPTVTILHPLVRRDEVSPAVDHLPNAAYFRQARNGVFVRMALLEQMLGDGNLF